MSLILEALRKSEAERRRGEAPDLRVELPPHAPAKRGMPRAAWLAGGSVAAVLAAAIVWWQVSPTDVARDGERREVAAGDVVIADEQGEAGPPRDATRPDRRRAAEGGPGTAHGAFPPVDRIEAPVLAPVPEPAPDLPLAPPPMAARAADEAAAEAILATPQPVAAPAAPAAAPAPARPPARPLSSAPPPATVPATGSQDASAIRIATLPAGQRERLPEARVSLHMWNEDPARRFAVIDGQRRVEGDRLGEATIVAIDREGVLLDLDGQRVRLPLP